MRDFIKGFIHGVKETPKGYFAPAVALWRLLVNTTESMIDSQKEKSRHNHA